MKKVLLTGAGGFVGQHTISLLLKEGYEVHAADIVEKPLHIPAHKNLFWHACDLLDQARHKELLSEVKPTHLLHFAWYAAPGKYWTSPENFRWVVATIQLAETFWKVGGKHFVSAGTCAEYDWNYGYLQEDFTPLAPQTVYGKCKNATRQLLEAYGSVYGGRVVWGRVFYLYGPHENPSRLVPSVISSLLRGETAKCTHGRQVRDFLHVEDVAQAFVRLLDSGISGAVNIGSGKPVTLGEIVGLIADELKAKDLVRLGAVPPPEGETPLLVANNQRLLSAGWQCKYNLRFGIQNAIQWWKTRLK